jgi:multimeric flavodoxin WrbA
MNVLGLISSPRPFGNSELAAKEIMRGLPDAWEKRMIRLSDMNLLSCTACYRCLSQEGHACVLKDDLDFILRHMLWADKIIIAAPCYVLGAHLGVHRLIDRLMPVSENYVKFAGKQCALVVSYGLSGWEGLAREEMLKIPLALGMDSAGAAVLKATLPGDSVSGRNLSRLRALAGVLAGGRGAGNYPPEDDVLPCPRCGSRLLTVKPDRSWRCPLCDGGGFVTIGDDGLGLESNPSEENRFSTDRRIEHERNLKDAKREFAARKDEIKRVRREYPDGDLWVRP